jgi:hypothetical protein
VVQAIKQGLPCSEVHFPYPTPNFEAVWVADKRSWQTTEIEADCRTLTERLRIPEVRELSPTNISQLKAHLAAGWVIVVGTSVTKEMLSSPGLLMYGLPLTPILGQERYATEGHAWVLVGYDHVDGNHFWKYQGRFFALSSWGHRFPEKPLMTAGVFTLPFGMLLTEGFSAFALRFLPQHG